MQPYLAQWSTAFTAAPDAWNLPDVITARWRKLLAQQAELAGDLATAKSHYEAALALGAKCKTALDVVTRKLEKAQEQSKTQHKEQERGEKVKTRERSVER